MSFDERIRKRLERAAADVDPDVERSLGAVEARARRPAISPAAILLAASIIVAALVLRPPGAIAPGGVGSSAAPSSGPSPAPIVSSPAETSYAGIAGTWSATLPAAEPAVQRDKMAGVWTMRLLADGELFLSAPATFPGAAGGLTGIAFTIAADRFRTNAFVNDPCGSVGTYAWLRTGSTLTFTPVDDACALRRTLLSSVPWTLG